VKVKEAKKISSRIQYADYTYSCTNARILFTRAFCTWKPSPKKTSKKMDTFEKQLGLKTKDPHFFWAGYKNSLKLTRVGQGRPSKGVKCTLVSLPIRNLYKYAMCNLYYSVVGFYIKKWIATPRLVCPITVDCILLHQREEGKVLLQTPTWISVLKPEVLSFVYNCVPCTPKPACL
jgi:hypothetical protein